MFMKNELLRMENIQSYKNGRLVLNHAHLNLFQSETIGIVGLNYSGKSTLVGGIAGFSPFEKGTVYFCEEKVQFKTIGQAREAGIFYIQERTSLIEQLSITENMFLHMVDSKNIVLHKKSQQEQVKEILSLFQIEEDENMPMAYLSQKNRLLIEVAKAVLHEAKIIILDNVLNKLSESGLEEFKNIFTMLKSLHIGIILIETGIKHLKPFIDRLFIMREGKTAAVFDREEIEDDLVVSLMIGEEFMEEEKEVPSGSEMHAQPLLHIKQVEYKGILQGTDFEIFEGETVGILNVNKHSGAAIAELLMGTEEKYNGAVIYKGKEVAYPITEKAIEDGIVVIPEKEAIFWDFTIEENITFMALKNQRRLLAGMRESELRYVADEMFSKYIKNEQDRLHLGDYVPKNRLVQKKIALCRALAARPDVLIWQNPTLNMDLFSKQKIYEDIQSLKQTDITLIIISQDIRELLQVCDRVIVVKEGVVDEQLPVTEKNRKLLIRKFGDQIKNI